MAKEKKKNKKSEKKQVKQATNNRGYNGLGSDDKVTEEELE